MKIPFAPIVGSVAFTLLPPDFLRGDPAKLLMPFLGLFMAGIFPAISLTIGSLKSGGFSVKRVGNLADELSRLLDYLQALFVTALIAALMLVTAEALHWGDKFAFPFYTTRCFNLVLGFCFGSLVAALPRIRRTFTTLLAITKEIAEDEASSKIRERMTKLPSAMDRYPTSEKFGELFKAERLQPPQ